MEEFGKIGQPFESQIESKESIKLTRNSKGYNYEIKVHIDTDESALARLDKLNKELAERYK